MNNDTCPNCGSPLSGDGFKWVLHCENADPENYTYHEPDAQPVFCQPVDMSRQIPMIPWGSLLGKLKLSDTARGNRAGTPHPQLGDEAT